jgi:hypothetical protein
MSQSNLAARLLDMAQSIDERPMPLSPTLASVQQLWRPDKHSHPGESQVDQVVLDGHKHLLHTNSYFQQPFISHSLAYQLQYYEARSDGPLSPSSASVSLSDDETASNAHMAAVSSASTTAKTHQTLEKSTVTTRSHAQTSLGASEMPLRPTRRASMVAESPLAILHLTSTSPHSQEISIDVSKQAAPLKKIDVFTPTSSLSYTEHVQFLQLQEKHFDSHVSEREQSSCWTIGSPSNLLTCARCICSLIHDACSPSTSKTASGKT